MRFKVKLTTKGGGKREVEIDATSVQDVKDRVEETYKDCTIQGIDLIPRSGYVRLYSHGEQLEVPIESIYKPF